MTEMTLKGEYKLTASKENDTAVKEGFRKKNRCWAVEVKSAMENKGKNTEELLDQGRKNNAEVLHSKHKI